MHVTEPTGETVSNRGNVHTPRKVDFGDKSWEDVRIKLARWSQMRLYRVDADILEDALQDAILDGMTYWSSLDSSHTGDPQKNFDYAVFRGKHTLSRAVQEYCRQRAPHATDDDLADEDLVPDRTLVTWFINRRASGQQGLDTFALEGWAEKLSRSDYLAWEPISDGEGVLSTGPRFANAETSEREEMAFEMLSDMSNEELEDFFTYFGDESDRTLATKLGVSHQTIGRRKAARRMDLRERAAHYGLEA